MTIYRTIVKGSLHKNISLWSGLYDFGPDETANEAITSCLHNLCNAVRSFGGLNRNV